MSDFDNCRTCRHPSDVHNVHTGAGSDMACNSFGCKCRAYEEPRTKWVRVLAEPWPGAGADERDYSGETP